MAVTNNYYQQQQQKKQQTQQAQPYTGLAGVSQNTAQQLGQMQSGYQPSAQVQQAQQNLQNVQKQKPGAYQSKYTPQLDDVLAQIQNPGEFKYEFNGDNLFKNYADMYTQTGRQASLDTQGQAAALTGGYGNSYGQQVGQQAYQQNLLSLYDRGMDLRDRAYGMYQDRLANNKDVYGLMAQREATDYGRYRDTTEDWKQAEEQAYNRMQNAEAADFDRYQVMLGYYQGLAELENQDYRSEQARQETIRQFNETMAENIREFDAEMAETIRSNKAAEDYNNRSLEETKRSNLASEDYNNRALDETIRSNKAGENYNTDYLEYLYAALDAQYGDHGEGSSSSSSGSGGTGGTGGTDGTGGNDTSGAQNEKIQNVGNNINTGFKQGVSDVAKAVGNYKTMDQMIAQDVKNQAASNANAVAIKKDNNILSGAAKAIANTATAPTISVSKALEVAKKNGWLSSK